eukprot:scaffold4992_cov101-Isochrysis_galbana.AAC.3
MGHANKRQHLPARRPRDNWTAPPTSEATPNTSLTLTPRARGWDGGRTLADAANAGIAPFT